ncbi:FkbM family methyltransferase [Streptomyces malaysiensis]|uniref:FkbM family methyltransferase n=1 Tax=Streptomyces malaysiensis TaxID=92644 RepID=UPI00371CFC8B
MQPTYIPDLLRTADAVPEGTPVVLSADGELSYRELWDQIAAVARQLRSAGVEPGDHVALYLPRSAGYVSALIAVMTIGAVAVPMDPEFPSDRLIQVVAAAKPRVILCEGDDHLAALGPAPWLALDTRRRQGDTESLAAATWRGRPAGEQTAMILFTSGSTGRPKGVRLHHAGLCNRLDWGHRHYRLADDDRVLHKASHAFDAAIHEIFSPLIAGGTLVIAPPGLQFDSLGIVRLIQEAEVTTAHFVPSVLRYVVDEAELAYCTSLRRVFCGGEALEMALVRRFRDLLPAKLYNGLAVATPSPDEALFLYRQIFDEDEYARFGLRIGPDAVIVDVGANIGLFSLWAARQADGVRVVAVEPNPDTLPYLQANLKLNSVAADVVPMAVTDRSGTATLTSFPQLSYLSGLGTDREEAAADLVESHFRSTAAATGDTGTADEAELAQLRRDTESRLAATLHQVATTDLSSIFDRFALDRVDLLKINTEGTELDVLRGLRPEHWHRVRQVCLEVERASAVGPEIRKILTNAGFSLHEIDDWNVDTAADVTYVYATRQPTETGAGTGVPAASDAWPGPGLLTARQIRQHAAAHLPSAMQPSQVVFVEDLPRLPNGKVAKLQLPPPPAIPAPTAADTSADVEEQLRDLWREVLSVDAVGDDDDFLGLGGHSLLALRVTARARSIISTETTPSACLKAPTFAAWLAEVLQSAPVVRG